MADVAEGEEGGEKTILMLKRAVSKVERYQDAMRDRFKKRGTLSLGNNMTGRGA